MSEPKWLGHKFKASSYDPNVCIFRASSSGAVFPMCLLELTAHGPKPRPAEPAEPKQCSCPMLPLHPVSAHAPTPAPLKDSEHKPEPRIGNRSREEWARRLTGDWAGKEPSQYLIDGEAYLLDAAFAAESLREQLKQAQERIDEDNAVCICGCPPEAHEDGGEDGESCDNEDHQCLRVCVAVRQIVAQQSAEVARLREKLLRIADRAEREHHSIMWFAGEVRAALADPGTDK